MQSTGNGANRSTAPGDSSIEAFHTRLENAEITRGFIVRGDGDYFCSHPEILDPVKELLLSAPDLADHEALFFARDPELPTVFFAFVHNTRRGLAQGGLRFARYPDLKALLSDGLRLSRAMTRKSALAELWWGGGKGILAMTQGLDAEPELLTPGSKRREELFRAYGRFVASLNGIYYTAEDIGTRTEDMNAILATNRFVTCIGRSRGGSGNPSPYTASGVLQAITAGWEFLTGSSSLEGTRVAVQGIGNVGGPLVEFLLEAGARVLATDVDSEALERFVSRFPDVESVEPDAIFDADAEIFAPCAIGGQVNEATIPRLKSKIVCGAANNILGSAEDAQRLASRGILFVPDYLANRTGIINCANEWWGYLEEDVQESIPGIFPLTREVLQTAAAEGITPTEAANRRADEATEEQHPMPAMRNRGQRLIHHLIESRWHLQG